VRANRLVTRDKDAEHLRLDEAVDVLLDGLAVGLGQSEGFDDARS